MTAWVKRVVEIHAGQHRENVGLQERDEQFEGVEPDRHGERQYDTTEVTAPAPSSMTTKPPNTLSVMWPASIFAKKRTEWLIGRDRKEMISIATTSGKM